MLFPEIFEHMPFLFGQNCVADESFFIRTFLIKNDKNETS